ncbi:MAG: hypothetical protein II867_02925 [Clostridia bacterium]|nr:hypothetical protein [Clostridia bacterium]
MKIKDIEKNLKKEGEKVVVPDVYARVKKAPINRLLSDPVHAFKRKMAMRMLTFSVIILLVVAISLSAIWLTPKPGNYEEYGYARVTINSDKVYGFAVNNAGIVYAILLEKEGGEVKTVANNNFNKKNIEDALGELYDPHAGDVVKVSCQFDNYSTASALALRISSAIRVQGEDLSVSGFACDSGTRTSLVEYLNLHLATPVAADATVLDLVQHYIDVSRAVS